MFLTALFDAQVALAPHAPAVISPSGTLSYAELDARANRLAHWLRARGAGPERIVALRMPRSAEIVVAQLAVLKAGAAYLPVDPAYPAERIGFMLRDAAPLLVLESEVDTTGLPETGPGVALDPAHPAYVIYTSGSTGQPKGVIVTHTGLANFATCEIAHFQVRPGDRVLQFSSPSFDASVLELCMALPSGAALVVPPEGPLLGEQLAEVLRDNRITHALIPPVAMSTVPDVPLPGFRTLVVGGDACTPDLVTRWAPGRRMINAYGPTESTVVSTWSEPLVPGKHPPIGRPIPGTVAHVLDDELRPASEGELYVTGAGLARGYLDRPGLTAQRFIANPFGPGRLYRTGDVVRWRDGVLEFVGRADHQVKIRGFRIEPGEIEAVLREHAGVREAVVVARADQGLKRLVAYVTGEADLTELRALVAGKLPDHMVPSAFVVLDALPLSPNGKLDRTALPAPAASTETPGFTAPGTPQEQRVAKVWAEVLGLDAVGAEDDFFQLGGDSVLAMRTMALLGGGLPLRTLFEHRTVAALAEVLPEDSAPEIPQVHSGQPVPLSRTQRRLRGAEGSDSNTAAGVRLTGPLDVPRLQKALNLLVARHDALRTTVHGDVQEISPHSTVTLELIDDDQLVNEIARPFDLRTGPLTRMLLTRDQVLVLCQHHIITDGRSVALLLDELARLYAGEQLPEPRLQYADFALWQQEQPVPSADYWRHKLDGLESLDLRTDRVRPPLRTTAGAVLRRPLGADLVRKLTTVGRAHDATLFMTLTTLVKVIMARYSGQRDIAVGAVNAGRDRAELDGVAGFFVNTLVLRSWLDAAQPFTAFLDQVRDTVLEAFAHDDVPFDQLVEELRPDRDPSRTPLVQAVVALQEQLFTRADFGGLPAEEVELPRPAARFDLVTEFWPRGDDLTLTLEYNTDLFDASTIERMADDLVALCEAVTANPDLDLTDFAGEAEDVARVRGFRVDPAVVEEVLRRHVDDAHVVVHDGRLVGYVTQANPAGLKGLLSQVLPDYLIPSAWVVLDRIDRANLPEPPAPRVERARFVAPRTPVEAVLAAVFTEVLGVGRVGVRDSFLELGGDSILAIAVVTKARAAGLHLTARDVFAHQTIAELAPRVRSVAGPAAEQGPVTGDVPLTPIQRWFFDHHEQPGRFHQSLVVDFPEDVNPQRLARAIDGLVEHHDALRTRYEFEDGRWRQRIEASGHSQLDAEIVAPRQVRLSAHHLVVDGISWRVLAEDLRAAYRGEPLPQKTTSFREWAQRLAEQTRTGGFDTERAHWQQITGDSAQTGTTATQRSVSVRLSEQDTQRVLRDVPPVYRTQVNDVLLAALGCVLSGWTGSSRVLMALEGHGREELLDGVDLSRTVGWFTSMFPVALDLPEAGWGETLKSVKEQLRAVPRRGIGYGALRYLTDAGLPDVTPEVGFNHLGRFDSGQSGMDLDADPGAPRPHAIDVVSRVEGDQLEVIWYYSTDLHDGETIARLADEMLVALRDIAHHCAQPEVGGRTPSDFPLAKLDQAACDRIALPHIEDVYPLTPMQAGMVFHSLDGVYLQQTSFVVTADPDKLAAAWQRVVDRTPVLRSSVVWEGVPEPVQVVHAHALLPVRHLDWTGEDREERLRALLDEDRALGVDLATAPLMRLTLARLSGGEVQVLWTFHHVLLDGWSVFQVLTDVLGEPAERPPFRDYVQWLQRQDDEAAEGHWRAVLGGFTEPTPLPFDRTPAGQHESSTTANLRISLSAEESAALYAFAREQRLTPGTVVQGAWAVLLARYGGRDDVCFGATVSGRPADLPGVDDITGIFINTLPVRVPIDDRAPVAAWLRALQEAQAEARRFEHVPLTRLHAWSGVEGGVNLFDSVLVFENYPADGLPLRDLRAVETTNFPLSATVYPDTELTMLLGYDPAVFDETTARGLGDHLRVLLTGMAFDADRTVGDLPMLTTEERHQVLVAWNDTAHEVPDCTLLDLLTPRDPDAVAVRFEGEAISGAELERRANRLAHRLITAGAGPERVVAVSLPRSIDLVVTLLAVLKAGAAYLPVDADLPADRVAFMLTDADPVLVVDSPLDGLGHPDTPPEVALTPDHPAYVIYTSGSTGKPKAVVVPHRGIVNRLLWTQHEYGLTPGDRVLQKTPASFDVSVWEFFWPLVAGATLVVAKPEGHRDPAYLADLIQRESITTVHFVPSMLRAFLREPAAAGCTRLRRVLCSGEALPPDLVRAWYEVLDVPLHNLYGPTEASVDVTSWATGPGADTVPIGKPVWNTGLRVLDAELRPVPPGVPGELYLAGAQLARGYLNRPGLTAGRFVADPFGPTGTRMYRTGDLARWRAGGAVDYLGRTDHQVKVRGLRIELGEIEAVLGDAVVVVVVVRDDRLVAYVTPENADVDTLRKTAEATLPDYMVPSVIVPLAEFPLSPNGKLDRRVLPDPEWAPTGHVAPRTPAEEAVAAIWAQTLGIDDVGAEDDFFALGGDSIRGMHVTSLVRDAFGVAVSPREVLAARTVSALATLVEELILRELEHTASEN